MKLHLGENIRENRRRMGLTQEQLADRLGVSFQSVSRWENGTTYPDMELIPQIARLFRTTLDALVGFVPDYGNEKEKAAYEDVVETLGQTMKQNDWNACIGLLQLIRNEYFNELDRTPYLFFNAVLIMGFTISAELLEEFRKMNEAVQMKAKSAWLRSKMISYMAEIEDDGHFYELVNRYSALDDSTTMEALFMHRYKMHGELEKYEKLRIVKKFRQLRSFFFDYSDRIKLGPVDFEEGRDRNAALLGMLHRLCLTEPDKKHPVSGNGKVDFFAEMRIMTGIRYASWLSGCGDTEGALTAIEDIADMIEQLHRMK
ncbi:MAG: helix-turn-helix transcriptional regulator, partial [Clostridia bacterium]|nr:helix-turn-helix transcriptional regulator [Clostridia bacterium]